MKYRLVIQPEAERHFYEWRRSGQKIAIAKIVDLLKELEEHPTTGIGQPERLKHKLSGYWSRRIDKHNRLIYSIEDNIVTVTVVSAKGHYGDR